MFPLIPGQVYIYIGRYTTRHTSVYGSFLYIRSLHCQWGDGWTLGGRNLSTTRSLFIGIRSERAGLHDYSEIDSGWVQRRLVAGPVEHLESRRISCMPEVCGASRFSRLSEIPDYTIYIYMNTIVSVQQKSRLHNIYESHCISAN